jgi:C4-dicarboxylate transporter, DctM subunit
MERIATLKYSLPVALLFLDAMGGIFTGFFTAVEAGTAGAFGALLILLVRRKLYPHTFWFALKDTARMAAMILILIVSPFVFNAFLAVIRIPNEFGAFLIGLPIGRYWVMVVVIFFYIVTGLNLGRLLVRAHYRPVYKFYSLCAFNVCKVYA